MGKLLLSLFAVLSLPLGQGGTQMPITINPNPLTQGQDGTITGTPGDVIDLDWDPPGQPTSVTIGADGKGKFKVPASATSLIATAPNGDTDAATCGPP